MKHQRKRRGSIMTLSAFLMVAMCAFIAFAVDLGSLFVVRTELQRTADASALAASRELYRLGDDLTTTVLAAAALQCIGGQMQGRLIFRNDDERERATRCGITDFDRKYELDDLAHGEVMIAATGVTSGAMLKGVRRYSGGASTHSLVMRSKSGTVRYIEAFHNFDRKTGFDPVDQ